MRRIAVVDSDPSVHEVVRDVLRDECLDVVGFRRVGEVEVTDALWDTVQVALIDTSLPDGCGLDLTRALLERREHIEVIVLSGSTSLESAHDAVLAGAGDYITKPFDDLTLLLHRIMTAMDRARLRRQQEDLLAKVLESEQRYALAAMGANDGLWDWNITSSHFYTSERWCEIVGLEPNRPKMDVEKWMDLIHVDDREETRSALQAHLKGATEQFVKEFRIDAPEGEKWVLARGMAVRDSNGRATRMAGSLSDISVQKRAEAKLAYDAMHDMLTGLPNRSLVHDRLTRAMARARRNGQNFAVLFLDMDRFKTINDSLGHLAGDELLLEAARRMEACLRETDTVARLGGDEFVIIVDDLAGETDATRVAERVQEKLVHPFHLGGHEVYSSVSIGIALYNDRYRSAEEMLRDADIAMYRAKAAGKACYRVFDEAMHRRALDLLRLETNLRRAVERNEFRLHYQPVVELDSREMVGCEALLRWERAQSDLLPDGFISLAEETGLIIPIGRWVFQQACQDLRTLNAGGRSGLLLSINISGRQFAQPDFADEIDAIIRQSGVNPENITLEITESVIMEDPEFARAMLEQLKRLRVGLAIDDFGTGYSSLSYLHRFPVDTLKIDRSFVDLLEAGGYELEIVKTIVHLARTLELQVIAEGVETEGQRAVLLELGCRLGQGFLFSKPLSDVDLYGREVRDVG